MRVPQMVSDFFEWRWAPCVGLTGGSLAFVAFAVLLIPTRPEGEPRVVTASALDNPQPQRAQYTASLARAVPEPDDTQQEHTVARPIVRTPPPTAGRAVPASPPPARGFSPILDRPPPPMPVPTPMAVPPPMPAPPVPVSVPMPATGQVPPPPAMPTAQPGPGMQAPMPSAPAPLPPPNLQSAAPAPAPAPAPTPGSTVVNSPEGLPTRDTQSR